MTTDSGVDADVHRRLAASLFNRVWELLGTPDRSPAEDDELLHATHASRHHWAAAATAEGADPDPARMVTGEWQCARVHAVLGHADTARHHAEVAMRWAEAGEVTGFLLGAVHEGLARAAVVLGDTEVARHHLVAGRTIAADLTDDADRTVLTGDLDEVEAALA